jgi:hypothetical protein
MNSYKDPLLDKYSTTLNFSSTITGDDKTQELYLQIRWILGILEQIEFANNEVLSDFELHLKILTRQNRSGKSSY